MEDRTAPTGVADSPRRRQRLNPDTAEDLVAAWERSGVSATAFCRDRPITTKTLLRWRDRLRPPEGLSRVVVAPSRAPACTAPTALRVVATNGLSIEVPSDCDEAVLRRVCRVLSC